MGTFRTTPLFTDYLLTNFTIFPGLISPLRNELFCCFEEP